MIAEIICIGTELLLGDIVNSNAAYLSKQLALLGIDVYHHSTVGDNPARLAAAIKLALSRADIVITTGGLGPTVDDITTATISEATGLKLIFDRNIASRIRTRFVRRHIKLPVSNLRQAYLPRGAIALRNDEGTAPGLFIKLASNKMLIALPGPPKELNPMFEKSCLPMLKKICGAKHLIKTRILKITGLPESKVSEKVRDILKIGPVTTVGIYARLGEVDLKIRTKAKSETDAKKAIAPVERKIRQRLGSYIFGVDNQTLEGAVAELLTKKKKTLAVAESCTGGLIANRITDVAGSSKYFKMGTVNYSNQAKQSILGVPAEILKRYGAVSKETATKMAQSVRQLANADIGLAVTGIAGPTGATKAKPVGLVYIAIAAKNKTLCKECHFIGSRKDIKLLTSQAALDMLRLSS